MHSVRVALALALALLCGFGPGDEAAPYVPPDFLAQPPQLPAGYDEAQALRLDLAEALTIAIKQNLGVSLARKEVKAAELGVTAATAGMYEPTVSAGYTHTGADRSGAPASDSVSVSATQQLPTGAHLSFDATATRGAGTRSSTLGFSLTQPLFRGFSRDLAIPQYPILTAKLASEQERHQLELSAANLIQQTEGAYWDVVLALYSYQVTLASKQRADDTVTLVRRQIAAGMTQSSDLIGAQNTYALREVAVLSAAQAVEQSWDALRTVLNLPREQWDRPLLPTDRPRFAPGAVSSASEAFETALHRRPELAQAALDLEASTLALRKADNDGLPQIDLGLRGSVSRQDTGYPALAGDPSVRDPAGWSATVNLTWTPLGRASKANREIARIQHEVRTGNRELRVQAIWNEVRASVRSQREAALQVVAASESRKLAVQSLDIETRKYRNGSSTNLNVASLQTGLAGAELTELQALVGHERAATAMLLSTGRLLEQRHIELQVGPR